MLNYTSYTTPIDSLVSSGFKMLISGVILGNNVKAAVKTKGLKNYLKQGINMKQMENSFRNL